MSEENVSSLSDEGDGRLAVKVILGVSAAVVGFHFWFHHGVGKKPFASRYLFSI